MAWSSRQDVERWFAPWGQPGGEPGDPVESVAGAIRYAALCVQAEAPACGDQSAALRALREALHWALEAFRMVELRRALDGPAPAPTPAPKAAPKPEPGPNAYLEPADPVTVDYVPALAVLNWSGDGRYTWRCGGCDSVNYGRKIGSTWPAAVACERCTATFRVPGERSG